MSRPVPTLQTALILAFLDIYGGTVVSRRPVRPSVSVRSDYGKRGKKNSRKNGKK